MAAVFVGEWVALMALATIVRPLFVVVYVLLLIAYSVVAGLLYGLL